MAMILSGVLLLEYLGEEEAARRLEDGLAAVIARGREVTYDLRPSPDDPHAVGTRAMGEAVIGMIRESLPPT
jgi:isocitrate dehydrogenase (NAD+)